MTLSGFDRWLEAHGRSQNVFVRTLARLAGFAVGNQAAAEGFLEPRDEPLPKWLVRNSDSEDVLQFARGVVLSSRGGANSAVSGLQTKASALLNVLMIAAPGSAVLAASSIGKLVGLWGAISFAFLVLGIVGLGLGLLMVALATGLYRSVELDLARLESEGQPLPSGSPEDQLRELKLREISALQNSASLAMQTNVRLANDLHAARRLAIAGSLLFGIGFLTAWTSSPA